MTSAYKQLTVFRHIPISFALYLAMSNWESDWQLFLCRQYEHHSKVVSGPIRLYCGWRLFG